MGEWLARRRKPEVWAAVADGQRERLEAAGVTPLPPAPVPVPADPDVPAEPSTAPVSPFERDIGP
ncbi:hypothetical protein GKJPGBOP_01925 [Streptomyces paromomycinus]|uniref:Uncharacterized protein n=1 Tax=Streptomyces paromomycinus TaxID=92743 RepID=A0A401VYY7_STREY|nr:hypothetical protein GKJPGBOP_01925 [Streptomyces paromomycinus]